MARIFNIYFNYKDTLRNAIVSVRNTPFFTEYTLKVDEELMSLIPGKKIISCTPGHLIFQNISANEMNPLMKEILNAISHHLQKNRIDKDDRWDMHNERDNL